MSAQAPLDAEREVYTPSRLNSEARTVLEGAFPLLWVVGEISNLARPRSGHLYFSIKDERAQVRCALFRNWARYLRFQPEDGLAVLLRGRVSVYEARGEYQLIVEHMEPAGEGALRAELERLRLKLDKEGLFADEHKRSLPRFPRRIGVVTSPSGAAIRDVLHVLARRFPGIPVRIYPVPVQGDGAAPAIVRALDLAGERRDCDVLILTRGGGSLEDLWAFNEEPVVRAVHRCPVPLISAVGHEVDVTLCDLAADVRAPTPSAAAELAVPDRRTLAADVRQQDERLALHLRRLLRELAQSTDWLIHRLQRVHPGRRLEENLQRLDALRRRQALAIRGSLTADRRRLQHTRDRLLGASPRRRLLTDRQALDNQRKRLGRAAINFLDRLRSRHRTVQRALSAVSPQATLDRGYAIVREAGKGRILRDAAEAPAGTHIEAMLARGRLTARVESSRRENEQGDDS